VTGRRVHGWKVQQGYTLVELLLVLGLLAAIGALAWPALERPFANRRLRVAADVVRTEWSLARVEAIRSGGPCVFRYAAGGRQFCRERQAGESPVAAVTEQQEEPLPAAEAAASPSTPKKLPEGVFFSAAGVPLDLQAAAADAEPAESDWSEPIFFYPDGTTSDARLVLANDRGKHVELTLRGLTGTVSIGEVLTDEEQSP
jgi:prepilin-type N-terminal cleavage/methylation domain-containing protein